MAEDKHIFKGDNQKRPKSLQKLPDTPPWRDFQGKRNRKERGITYQTSEREVEMVNAALYLRRPLLLTGSPGVGKSSLAYAVAYELDLGEVLVWPITSKSILQHGLYSYDALARLQEAALHKSRQDSPNDHAETIGFDNTDIGRYIRLGPIGTAFLDSKPRKPRVVLIDEIDKSDIDLPNDLLHLFEEGEFEIPEVARLPQDQVADNSIIEAFTYGGKNKLPISRDGIVRCKAFPLVIMTSNGEREFPPAFLRRCLRLTIEPPNEEKLREIVKSHLGLDLSGSKIDNESPEHKEARKLIEEFLDIRGKEGNRAATDQLLNAIYIVMQGVKLSDKENLRSSILKAFENV